MTRKLLSREVQTMPEIPTTHEFFVDTWGAESLFASLPAGTVFPAVFGQCNITPAVLDTAFFDAYGERPPGVVLKRHRLDTISNFASYIWARFSPRWTRYCTDMVQQYVPSENYSRDETETITKHGTGTDTTRHTYPGYKETNKTGHSVTTKSSGSVYGFDSAAGSPVPANTEETTTTYDQRNTTPGGDPLPGDTLEIEGSQVSTFEHGAGESVSRSLIAVGNIGTMTAAQMLKEDLQYYIDNGDIIDYMIKDIADLLTLPIYD